MSNRQLTNNERLNLLEENYRRLSLRLFELESGDSYDDEVSYEGAAPCEPFKPGTIVWYNPNPLKKPALWAARVIPTPPGARTKGKKGPLIYVIRCNDWQIRGCYSWNLQRRGC